MFLVACTLPALAAREQDPVSAFTWTQALEGERTAGALYRLRAVPELFDGSVAFGQDLRIIDAEGRQWPWYIWKPSGSSSFKALPIRTLNKIRVEVDYPYLRVDLHVGEDAAPGKRPRHNRIMIDTAGQNFIRRVEVFGSEDRESWGRLSEGYLIDHRQPSRIRNTTVHYPESDMPYLQLRIHPNARDSDESIELQSVKMGRNVSVPGEWQEVALTPLEVPEAERVDGARVYLFDTGANRQPVERLTVDVADEEYARPLLVFGRHSATNDWRVVHRGEIHRLGTRKSNTVKLGTVNFRQLKIALYHYDDAPLEVSGFRAEAVPRYLVFEAKDGPSPALYYGSEHVRAPRFDLKSRRGPRDAARAAVVTAGPRVSNPAFKVRNIDRLMPWIAGIAVALVSLLLIWVIAGMLKKGDHALTS